MILFIRSGLSKINAVAKQPATRGAVRSDGKYAVRGAVCGERKFFMRSVVRSRFEKSRAVRCSPNFSDRAGH